MEAPPAPVTLARCAPCLLARGSRAASPGAAACKRPSAAALASLVLRAAPLGAALRLGRRWRHHRHTRRFAERRGSAEGAPRVSGLVDEPFARRGVLIAALAALGPPQAFAEMASPTSTGSLRSLVWRPMDGVPAEAEVFGRIESDTEWSLDFIIYLARILLNYDQASAAWWQNEVAKVDAIMEEDDSDRATWVAKRSAKLRERFADFAASVEFGLRRYQEEGRRSSGVLKRLVKRYGKNEESRRQLALAFTLLDDQPRELLASLLDSLGPEGRLKAVFSPGLPDYLAMDPTRLLPSTQFPVWDGGAGRWVIPGFRAALSYKDAFADREPGGAVSVFGPRGNELVVKERPLGAMDYALFALSGAFGCSFTHSLVIPLDVVKTRLQAEPGRYSNLVAGAVQIQKEEGWQGLTLGWEPTVLGYLWYGITVYPGYEFFKRLFLALATPAIADSFRAPLVLLAGAAATVFACIGVCPAEACRIRMVADSNLRGQGLLQVAGQIWEKDGFGAFYDGLTTILVRQVLFGMMKFLVFDYFADFLFDLFPVLAQSVETQLLVSLFSGAVAGLVSSVVSQPADSILTRMNQQEGRAAFIETGQDILKEQGLGGFFAGLGSRSVWAACIISGQFFLYDVCKSFLGVKDLRMFLDVQV
eukprot:TRINITY_DN79764_c0_g1_i1.p1 TRINITY_DN79764_c0_g1~~TRINITY_DN79764_c0_g1_i1.p1  ORF type:complete len:647 (+),score=122.80 TRINITY_DN79764_c0_g1_i1:32-1972(+)